MSLTVIYLGDRDELSQDYTSDLYRQNVIGVCSKNYISVEIWQSQVCWHSHQPSFGADGQVAVMRWVASLQLEKPETSDRFISTCRSHLPGSSDWILMYM